MYFRFCGWRHVLRHRSYGNNDVGAMRKQIVKIFNVFARRRHAAWLCLRVQRQQMAHRGRSVMPATCPPLLFCRRPLNCRINQISKTVLLLAVRFRRPFSRICFPNSHSPPRAPSLNPLGFDPTPANPLSPFKTPDPPVLEWLHSYRWYGSSRLSHLCAVTELNT